jgi:hypothetical protein
VIYAKHPPSSRATRRTLLRSLRSFWRDEAGSELVQFVLILPILIAFLWGAFEFWQMMTLKSAIRVAVAQAARYVTAFAALPDTINQRPESYRVYQGAEGLINAALARERTIFGSPLTPEMWEIRWYRVHNPEDPRWQGNLVLLDAENPLADLECNDQFAIEVTARIPWRTLVFGLTDARATDFALQLSDTAMGGLPCLPECQTFAWVNSYSAGPGGCSIQIGWEFNCSYLPDRLEIRFQDRVWRVAAPRSPGYQVIQLAPGESGVADIVTFGGSQMSYVGVNVGCP